MLVGISDMEGKGNEASRWDERCRTRLGQLLLSSVEYTAAQALPVTKKVSRIFLVFGFCN